MSSFFTGPTVRPQTEVAALRERLEAMEQRLALLEANRAPNPVPMPGQPGGMNLHELNNAGPMSAPSDGHVPTFNEQTGLYEPRLNLASLIFSMTGTLVTKVSDPMHSRWTGFISGVSADLTTFGTGVTFVVNFNGGALVTVTMTSASTGFIPIPGGPQPIRGYVDLVTVATTAVDGTSAGLVVHVELQ